MIGPQSSTRPKREGLRTRGAFAAVFIGVWVLATLPYSADAQVVLIGDWSHHTRTDDFTDEDRSLIMATSEASDRIALSISCEEGRLEVAYLHQSSILGIRDGMVGVRYRVDSADPVGPLEWVGVTSGAWAKEHSAPMIRAMSQGDSIVLQAGSSQASRFSLKGFTEALRRLPCAPTG